MQVQNHIIQRRYCGFLSAIV